MKNIVPARQSAADQVSLRKFGDNRVENINHIRKTYLCHLRAKLVGRDLPYHLVVIDSGWRRNQINMEVGDVALINGAVDDPGGHIKFRVRPDGQPELIAKSAGEARFATTHCSGSIRISSRCYRGLADYRYLSISDVVDRKSAA